MFGYYLLCIHVYVGVTDTNIMECKGVLFGHDCVKVH